MEATEVAPPNELNKEPIPLKEPGVFDRDEIGIPEIMSRWN